MKKGIYIIRLAVLLLCSTSLFAQNEDQSQGQPHNSKIDSLLRISTTAKQDTNLAKLYFDIADLYFFGDIQPQKAKEYYFKTKALSDRLDWNEGRYLSAVGLMEVYLMQEEIDSAIIVNQQALSIARKENNEIQIAKTLGNLGICYQDKKWYETALNHFREALSLFEKEGDKFRMAHFYITMAYLYNSMDMLDESLVQSEKSLDILNETPDAPLRAEALMIYSLALIDSKHQYEEVKNCVMEAERIFTLHDNKYALKDVYSRLGLIANMQYDMETLEVYTRKMLENTTDDDILVFCQGNRNLARIERHKGNFARAEAYVKESLEKAKQYDMPSEEIRCYSLLENLSAARHDFRQARFYETKADSVHNKITSDKALIYAREMAAKYETGKKEIQIATLEEEKQLMIWLSIAGGTALLAGLIALFFVYLWTKQKRRKAELQVKQLEQEKQLIATQAVLDGEVQERTRLARDLHDGLGSILAAAKYNLFDIKQIATLGEKDVKCYHKAVSLLDDSMNEMRRVAHHLMPEPLSRTGLKQSVADFCNTIPIVKFSYYGDDTRFDPKLEVMVYRILHELVSNAMKHAKAEHILVQIVRDADKIYLTVQDDGRGFDTSTEYKGMGLRNIQARVTANGGELLIDSTSGKGTEVNVEIPVN
jgi:signal transduction histidine kinase